MKGKVTQEKKTTRVATVTKYEVYNRFNLKAVSEPMSEVDADGLVYGMRLEHRDKFVYCDRMAKQLEKGFPYAIRKLGNKGCCIGSRDRGEWIDFWLENKRLYNAFHKQWTSEEVADFVRLINMSGVLKQIMVI